MPCRKASSFSRLLVGILLLIGAVLGTLYYFGFFTNTYTEKQTVDPGHALQREETPVPRVRFTDITKAAGISFVHTNGLTDKKLLPETMCGGVAVIDFDNDGKPDLLFVNACPWPTSSQRQQEEKPTLVLYRNLGNGKFQDVTKEVGLAATMFGMGATVGDYDNDGWPDLFVTGVGGNHLFQNIPDKSRINGRRFVEATASAGVGGPGGWPDKSVDYFIHWDKPICFSTSASFLDYDGDGKLDLFVCNYVRWSPAYDLSIGFKIDGKERMFGQPKQFEGEVCFLYHNEGNGKFTDVSKQSGVQVFEKEGIDENARLRPVGKSLGVIVCDADEDGWPDIFVANDTVRNFLFHNQPGPNGTRLFREEGVFAGVAFAQGETRGAMGIDWAPYYRPGCNALLITNFANESDTFLCQDQLRRLEFSEVARPEGIAGESRVPLKFGAFFFDYDLDGRLDFLTCNGHLDPSIHKLQPAQTYKQPVQLFWSKPVEGFEPVREQDAGPDLFQPLVGRGCAYADLDSDGDLDVILVGNGGPALVLRNDNQLGHHWVRFKLQGDGVRSNRSAIGARIILETKDGEQRREIAAARGYISQSELTATFGLGKTTEIERVTIHWPGKNGGKTVLEKADLAKLSIDKEHTIKQGAQ
ncbi:MAG TPA: CRTAC1 family protein [Gemmataceae bacterium]|nr:CRTAC1 family protein [Gemmataceae bacterium]